MDNRTLLTHIAHTWSSFWENDEKSKNAHCVHIWTIHMWSYDDIIWMSGICSVPESTNKKIDATYLVLSILLRTSQAIGAAAVATSAMAILSTAFPGNTIKVLVCIS
ncbi:hypothetical protein EB796_015425 [Bugula neritina]|uniref:Uncharacterized protein n=1 Tax=Bugula neritina TaxID=10212 RepID=A0A7J7JKW6_BUGNE|nr:hypothetical protein EB796_015425 [Bugula neritina]